MSEKWNRKMEPRGPLLQVPSETRSAAPEPTQTCGKSKSKQKRDLAEWKPTEMKDEIPMMKDEIPMMKEDWEQTLQNLDKIDEKKQELLQLELTSVEAEQALDFCKRKLQDAMATSMSLKKEISQKKELLEKIERETAVVEKQRAEAESLNRRLRKQLSDYGTPPVLAYVQKKMAVADLENSIKVWEKKVAIAEMHLQSYRRTWNQVKMAVNQQ